MWTAYKFFSINKRRSYELHDIIRQTIISKHIISHWFPRMFNIVTHYRCYLDTDPSPQPRRAETNFDKFEISTWHDVLWCFILSLCQSASKTSSYHRCMYGTTFRWHILLINIQFIYLYYLSLNIILNLSSENSIGSSRMIS